MAQPGPQTGWPTWAVRIPQELEDSILDFARNRGYVGNDGSVHKAAAVRALLLEGLKSYGETVMERGQLLLLEATNAAFLEMRARVLQAIGRLGED
jgi:hypothetical protein